MVADALLARLTAAPDEAGIFLDFDGVLAPIVSRPEDAYPPAETRIELERLVARYALVGVVSGRAGEDVRAASASTGSCTSARTASSSIPRRSGGGSGFETSRPASPGPTTTPS